jgi:hypothetical protein
MRPKPRFDPYENFTNSLAAAYEDGDRMKWAHSRKARHSTRQLNEHPVSWCLRHESGVLRVLLRGVPP